MSEGLIWLIPRRERTESPTGFCIFDGGGERLVRLTGWNVHVWYIGYIGYISSRYGSTHGGLDGLDQSERAVSRGG